MKTYNNPLVSICIPIYNGEKYITETLKSVINQTYQNLEIVISNNASTDRSIEIIKSFNDPRIKIYSNPENYGIDYNFKKVLSYATGEFMSFLAADDLIENNAIEEAIKIFNDDRYKNVVLVSTYIEIINNKGEHVLYKKNFFGGKILKSYWGIRLNFLIGTNILGEPSASVFKKWAYDKIPEPKFKNINVYTGDVDLKNELFLIGDGYVIPKPLGKFRLSNESSSVNVFRNKQAKLFREYAMNIYNDNRYNLSFFWIITATINSIIFNMFFKKIIYFLYIKNK